MMIKSPLRIAITTIGIMSLSCLAHLDGLDDGQALDEALTPEVEAPGFPRRSGDRLPSNIVSALFLWLAQQQTGGSATGNGTPASSPYALTAQEAENLNLTITIEEARGERLSEIRQFQAQNLKEVSKFIGSPDFVEIGDLIGYPEGYKPGMTLADLQAGYVQNIRDDLKTANPELVEVYKQAITYQIFGLLDMLEKTNFGPDTIEPEFLTTALADLAQLRAEIIDLQRGPAASPVTERGAANDGALRTRSSISLGGLIGSNVITDQITESIERVNVKRQNESMYAEFWPTYFTRENVRSQFRQSCGCALKGSQPFPVLNGSGEIESYAPYKSLITPSSDSDIAASPNQFNNLMLGDSITRLGGNWNFYTPGFGIVNAGVGSATSQDVAEWLDFCAAQNTDLWNKPHVQAPGCADGTGNGGRFACNPPPGTTGTQVAFNATNAKSSDRYAGYVQFQNRNVYLMIGGNDFNIEMYKSQMQTLPVLIPFRHMNVANQVNKIISYVQYQAGTRVNLIGYMPLPSYFPGDELDNPVFNLIESLHRLGLENRFADWFTQESNDTTTVNARFQDLPGGRFITASEQLLRNAITDALRGQELSGQVLFDCIATMQPLDIIEEKNTFCDAIRGDQTWLSHRVIELNAVFASVAAARQTSMYSLYFTFLDYSQASRGCWWCGNKAFWSLNPGVSVIEEVISGGTPIPGNPRVRRGLNDSIHPNELGYFAYGATLNSIMQQERAFVKQAPFGHNDGCFVEPVDPAPFEACKALGSTFRFIDGQCVDTAPPPPGSGVGAPVIVGNPNGAPVDRPDEAVTNPTVEPPPLPGLTDDHLFLLALCFLFGQCTF
jgi:hypothetical protein